MSSQAKTLHDQLEQIGGCGDGSCIVHVRPGMHTNGGCRCNRESQKMSAVIYWHKRAVAEQAQQIERLRALVETAYAEAWYHCDEGVRTFAFSWKYSDSRAALQPKEGNP